ncbi:hypothetical protein P9112_009062 [Eukaryota sp. TZLM1-RC]
MSNLTASLINGSVGQNINSNPPHQESPPTKKSYLSVRKSSPPPGKRSTSPAKNAPPAESNIGNHTYDPHNILPNEMKLPLGAGNHQLPSKVTERNEEDTSNTFTGLCRVPDNDPLFANCLIDAQSGLKLSKSGKILVPSSMRSEILLLAHGSIEAGHPQFAECWKSLQQSDFQRPDMRNDLLTHVNACIPCKKTAPVPKTTISSTGSLHSVCRPFESLHCDSIGSLSADIYVYKYIVHFVDAFSKFCILVPTKDLKATTIVNALISSVYSVFGAPRRIHSDNGPEFANKIFSLLCQFLNIAHSQSLPHYHHSNGLIKRQHRCFLQVIRRMLLDFSDYHNWSDYVPLCQMVLNSQERKALNTYPYCLIFGSDTSPRLLPNQLLNSLSTHPLPPDKPEFIDHLLTITKKLLASWEAVTLSPVPLPSDTNDRVFVLREKPDKLHGHFVGPYVVLKVLSPSSLLVQNPVSGSSLKTATHLVKPCLSSLPPEILDAYVAADSGELILDAIIDITDESATVL